MPTPPTMDSAHRSAPLRRVDTSEHAALPRHPQADRALRWKHRIDRVAAALLVLMLAPLLAAVALGVKLARRGPVLVRDRRLARDGSSFDMLRFQPLPFLRRWCLDELPQLFNVLKGEMSFVGPRPERPEFVELFGEHLRRHDQPRLVRPGITGWAQVRGLDGPAPLAERVRWDDVYVESWSLALDLRILALTLRGVWRAGPPSDG